MQHYQRINAKHRYKQRLCAMDYQRKNRCVGCRDTVKYHYAYDGKMPWPCTVRGRDHHRNTSCDKKQKSCKKRKAAAEGEAEETEIELHKIAEPNTYGFYNKKPSVFHFHQRADTLYEIIKERL